MAASLRRRFGTRHELIAAVPAPTSRWGQLLPATTSFLGEIDVRLVPVVNEVDATYPIANKISALGVATDADKVVLLDSDTLCLAPFDDEACFGVAFAAKPADLPNMSDERAWRRVYRSMGLPLPSTRVATTLHDRLVLPYFNAGFVAVDADAGLGDEWVACARRIDRLRGVPERRPHLDQIALSVAVARLGLAWTALDSRFNWPAHRRPLDPERLPFVCHYHSAAVARREPALAEEVRSLLHEHPSLPPVVASSPDWSPLLQRRPGRSAQRTTPDLLVTGIPGSGSDLLCDLLRLVEGCAVVDEPPAMARSLRDEVVPWGVATHLRDLRRDVVESEKSASGRSHGLVLATSATPGYLARVGPLRRALPRARIAVCVREPLDTVTAWKHGPPPWRDAAVAGVGLAGLDDPRLTSVRRRRLEEIAALPDPVWRRAAWWRYLAGLVLDEADRVTVVRHADLVADPTAVLERLLGGWPVDPVVAAGSAPPLALGAPTADDDDRRAVRALCAEPASELGLELSSSG